jgi:diguanylate cyclase (GGDEF)-like protein
LNFIQNTIDDYLKIDSTIITLVTIGLITLITILAYSLERYLVSSHPSTYLKVFFHLLEGSGLALAMTILQKTFHIINNGSINNGWLYANAQMTIMLYALYLMRNRIILMINIVMPFVYHEASNFQRLDSYKFPYFVIAYLCLMAITIYIYLNQDKLLNNARQFIICQTIYGVSWWLMLWVDHSFQFYRILNMVLVFLIYMAIIRYCERKMQETLNGYDHLKVAINYDELTGIRNRASFDKSTKAIYQKYTENSSVPLTIAMFDIDRFKKFNDTFGHSTGDSVLRHVANTLERELFLRKTQGQIFRFGGEEFIIIFRGKTAQECSPIIVDLRNALLNSPLFLNGNQLNVNISFGVAQLRDTDKSFKDLFERVDSYLYQSKNSGRNSMTIEGKTTKFDDPK